MEELATQEYQYVHHYSNTPVYSVQVSKQGCRVIIEAYAEDYRFVENNGESMMIPFNYMITNSGEQKVKIKIYPKEGEQYLTKYAHVQVNLYHAPSKESGLKDYQKINSFALPEGLEPQKLPYYEHVLTFDAQVPYDYSDSLAKAKDLRNIPNIRGLVEKKYKGIWEISKNNDFANFAKEFIPSFAKVSNTTYESKEEISKLYINYNGITITTDKLFDKQFLPLDDCELQFYADGKVVSLWHKKSFNGGLSMTGKYKDEKGEIKENFSDTPIFLYMPAGSNELKVW